MFVWESKDRFQDKLIFNPALMQSRGKGCPSVTVEVNRLELITNLVTSGAGYGIIPAQVVKSQRYNLAFKISSHCLFTLDAPNGAEKNDF